MLTVSAEWINTLNNTISGSIYLRDKALYPGTGCTINGVVGQLSVQAADFSILVIAVVTLLTVTRTTYLPAASTMKKVGICLSVWIVPIITTSIATSQGAMGPVSGNWCWIMSTRTDLRYALTHGWRIAIIFCTAGIYIFIWWFMHRHFRSLASTTDASMSTKNSWMSRRRGFKKMKDANGRPLPDPADEDAGQTTELTMMSKSRISRIGDDWELSAPEAAYIGDEDVERGDAEEAGQRAKQRRDSTRSDDESDDESDDDDDDDDEDEDPATNGGPPRVRIAETQSYKSHPERGGKGNSEQFDATRTTDSEFPTRRETRHMEREIKRVLLLNAYPIMYVLLWIPGLTNRIMEASGNKSDSRVLAALQASSQFVGLANALTYGFNAALRTKVKRWWRGKKKAMGWGGKAKARKQQRAGAGPVKVSDGTPGTPATGWMPQTPGRQGGGRG